MFTLEKFLELMTFFYELDSSGTSTQDLDIILESIARSDQIKAQEYFTKVVDSIVYNTADNRRLRKFMVNWYASLRTLTSIQDRTTDVYSLPEEQLNEILKSFGYNFLPGKIIYKTKLHS